MPWRSHYQPGGATRTVWQKNAAAVQGVGLAIKPGDLRNRAFRMEITVTPYADAQFTQPATDANPGNDVINFWLMRAC